MQDKHYMGKHEKENERPPFVKNWNQLYGIVIAELVILIFLFYLFTQSFS